MEDQEQQNNSQHSNEELELKEYRNDQGEFDVEKIKKLDEEKKYYRTQIAKLKQLPGDKSEYGKDFAIDSKYTEYLSKEDNKKKIDDLFDKLDTMSLEKGIGIDRNHDIRRFVLDELTAMGAIDLTPEAEKQKANQQAIDDRNTKIQEAIGAGTDREAWDKGLDDWLHSFCNSEAEYALHSQLAKSNATWALSLNKMRQGLMGNRIPVIDSDPQFNQAEWDRTFAKADVDTQNKMLEERAKKLTQGK